MVKIGCKPNTICLRKPQTQQVEEEISDHRSSPIINFCLGKFPLFCIIINQTCYCYHDDACNSLTRIRNTCTWVTVVEFPCFLHLSVNTVGL